MKNDRKRVSIDHPYLHALGLAFYCFVSCEWNAAWSAERLLPGYVNTIEAKHKTAGHIAHDLIKLINELPDPALKAICLPPACEFQRLVQARNSLFHGKPGTDSNGDQRLFSRGRTWTIADIDAFSDEVTACSGLLNEMVHKHLLTVS